MASVEELRSLAGTAQTQELRRLSEVPIPEPIKPRLTTQPRSLTEASSGLVTRGQFEMAGGMTGAALAGAAASPTGPGALFATLAGGGLGAAGGSLVFDSLESLLSSLDVIGPQPDIETLEPLKEALRAGGEDVTFAGGFSALGQIGGAVKPALGKILGLRTAEVGRVVEAAARQGIPVGAIDVAQGIRGRVMRGSARVLGIFPFIGGPFRSQGVKKAQATIDASNRLLNNLAPNATLSSDLGLDMVDAARGSQKEFRDTAARLYDNFRQLSKDAGEIVPTAKIKEMALEFAEQQKRGAIEGIPSPSVGGLDDFIEGLTKAPDRITVDQYQRIGDDLKTFVNKAQSEGFDVFRVVNIKLAMEEAMSDLRVSQLGERGEAIVNALDSANAFYSKGIAQFQTSTAQRFGRVDKNIFRPGPVRLGSLNEDEIARTAVNLKSRKAVQDLRGLVGDDLVNKAARNHVESAWDDSLIVNRDGQILGLDWDKFSKAVGVSGKRAEKEALEEFLKGGSVNANDLKELISVAGNVVVPKSVNQFIARRAALGGLGSALGGATVTTLVADSALKSVGAAFLLRHFTKILSDPRQLKTMRVVLDTSVKTELRRQALGRVIQFVEQETPQETFTPGS